MDIDSDKRYSPEDTNAHRTTEKLQGPVKDRKLVGYAWGSPLGAIRSRPIIN